MSKLTRILLGLLGMPTKMGQIALAPGHQVIQMKTGWTPSRVWIDLGQINDMPCCGGSEDKFEITIVPHGFIITATVNSNCRELTWFAVK